MANYLKMAQVQTIFQLKNSGWSNRQIERELGIHRALPIRESAAKLFLLADCPPCVNPSKKINLVAQRHLNLSFII